MLGGEEQFAGEGAFGGAGAERLFRGDFYDIGIIIFLRNVRENQIARAAIEAFGIGQIFADRVIRKMPGAGKHALLDNPRIRTHLQHFQIVIRFQYQTIGIAQMNFYQFRQVAEIGDDGHLRAVRAEGEAHRIGSIVGNRERVDINIANREMLSGVDGFDAAQAFFEAIGKRALQRIERWFGDVERRFPQAEHLRQAIAMIGVFVGNENAVELLESDAHGSEARKGFALAETAIDEEAGVLGFEQGDVARTAGSQDGDAQADKLSPEFAGLGPVQWSQNKFLR